MFKARITKRQNQESNPDPLHLYTKLYCLSISLSQEIKDECKDLARIHHSTIYNSKILEVTRMSNNKRLIGKIIKRALNC